MDIYAAPGGAAEPQGQVGQGGAQTNGIVSFAEASETRSSESDGRSNVTDCFELQFVLIALIGLDCPDWF